MPVAALTRNAEADGFRPNLCLARREALRAIKALRDAELPLFAAAAECKGAPVPEADEPTIPLRPMLRGA